MQKEQRKTSASVMMETTTEKTSERVSEKKSPVPSKRQTKEEEVGCGNIWYTSYQIMTY